MVIGDPYKFGINIEVVESWSDNHYINGIFCYFLDGYSYPKEIYTHCLNSDLYMLFKYPGVKKSVKDSNYLFNLDKIKLIKILSFEENNKYKFSTTTMEDYGYYFYFIPKAKNVRIIGWKNIGINIYSDIIDCVLSREYFWKIIDKLKEIMEQISLKKRL